MSLLTLAPQPVRVRPHHLETPRSYLRRLCEANLIDPATIAAATRQRRRLTGSTTGWHLALIIRQLGGPGPSFFARAYVAATGHQPTDHDALLARTYRDYTTDIRTACTHCTAGQAVTTFNHHRFNICLKHHRWLATGTGPDAQRPVPRTGQWDTAERRYRRAAATGYLTHRLIDATRTLVAAHTGPTDPIAAYPATSKILHTLAQPRTWTIIDRHVHHPLGLTDHLQQRLAWIPGPDPRHALAQALTSELIASRSGRIHELNQLLRQHYTGSRRPPPQQSLDNITVTPTHQ